MLDKSPRVALLGSDDAVRAQLRSALAELGAKLVYEGDMREADAAAVTHSQPEVVLLNLDAEEGEDALDGLEALLLDPSMRVVFNEAETTAALSGWDLARWARHLAAKVLGHDRTIPPPPAGAEYLPDTDLIPSPGAPPTPVSQAKPLSMATMQTEATESFDSVPIGSAPTGWRDTEAGAANTASSQDFSSNLMVDSDAITNAMSATEAPKAEVLRTSPPESDESVLNESADTEALQVQAEISIDFDDLDAALAAIDAGDDGELGAVDDVSMFRSDAVSASELELELEALSRATVVDEHAAYDVDSSRGGSGAEFEGASLSFALNTEDVEDGAELDADVAALAAGLEAMEQAGTRAEMEVRDPDFFFNHSEANEVDTATEKNDDHRRDAPAPKSTTRLELADELAEVRAGIPTAKPPAPTIDISYLSLEALPDPGLVIAKEKVKPVEDAPYLPRPGIDLMLAPLDAHLDETASKPEDAIKNSAAEADWESEDDVLGALSHSAFDTSSLSLDVDKDKVDDLAVKSRIPRVLVLGASIGGPDALRTFLAGLPADFPALLVLAQHLESGFFDRLAQQLQKISKLPVRVASADTPACAGEVVIIPSGERVKISRDGRVRREAYVGPTHYRPCIDDVMHDIADAFGKQATAIIFSGMAGDAVEGAVYLTSKGGEVWAQTPASCVVSSMVDGAQARGVVEFVGSPRELAEQCVARYGQLV